MRILILALLISACRPSETAAPQNEAGLPGPVSEAMPPGTTGTPPPPPPPPAAPSLPGLLPLSEAQVASVLGSGARCALGDGGEPLMVADLEAAVVNDGGRLLRLAHRGKNWAALREGGRFVRGGLRVEVDAGAEIGRDGVSVKRDASVTLVRGRRGLSSSHGPSWSCGA